MLKVKVISKGFSAVQLQGSFLAYFLFSFFGFAVLDLLNYIFHFSDVLALGDYLNKTFVVYMVERISLLYLWTNQNVNG